MINYQYSYLLVGVGFLIIWLALFLWRKNTRKEMLIISLLFGFAGPIADLAYTKDWWHPLTITNSAVGIEAVIGGVASASYETIFNKKLKKYKKRNEKKENLNLLWIILSLAILFIGGFYIIKLNSLVSTIIALLLPTLYIWYKRKDLIKKL